ncbi:MAG: SDR family oxidoreductase [Sedimentisphaerales bacterium]|nr:SDR family oxidoreductase [Sedimentisphaerales bacterium]
MLGHKLMQLLSSKHEVTGTVRGSALSYNRFGIFDTNRLIGGMDVNDFDNVIKIISQVKPQFIINCVGIIKQLETANDPLISISINSLLPHRLAGLCRATGARLIHISTDCVFSGNQGMYKESDISDATDLYGRTKFLGEVSGPNCLTLRTSIIGRELESHNGLIEWFLRPDQKEIRGFRRVIYTGLTTIALESVLELVMEASEELTGVYQLSSDPINKYDLLLLARDAFGVSTNIVPVDMPVIDRSLDSSRFRKMMNYNPPSWQSMIQELAADKTPYSSWNNHRQANYMPSKL